MSIRKGRIDLKNILARLADEGKTVLISSHILAEMNEFCTSVAIMERGEVMVSGRIDEVNRQVMGDRSSRSRCSAERTSCCADRRRRSGRADRAHEQHLRISLPRRRRGGQRAPGRLVGQGVRVSSFARRKDNLEELFLKVGSKELS